MLPVVNAQKPNKQKLNHATKSFPQLKDVLKGVRAVNVVRYCLEVNDCCFMWHDVFPSSDWSWVLDVGTLELYESEMQVSLVLLDLSLQDDMCNVGYVEKNDSFNIAYKFL